MVWSCVPPAYSTPPPPLHPPWQALNLILLTSPEVRELRDQLREAASRPPGAALFTALYPCWTHSTGAVLSLCLLAQVRGGAQPVPAGPGEGAVLSLCLLAQVRGRCSACACWPR